jgi:copper chaperone
MQFHIQNMNCGGCARSVTKAIESVDPSAVVTTDVAARKVDVTSTVPGHGYKTARCAGHAAILTPVAASGSRAFCSALI